MEESTPFTQRASGKVLYCYKMHLKSKLGFQSFFLSIFISVMDTNTIVYLEKKEERKYNIGHIVLIVYFATSE